jgi:hypothetical protein
MARISGFTAVARAFAEDEKGLGQKTNSEILATRLILKKYSQFIPIFYRGRFRPKNSGQIFIDLKRFAETLCYQRVQLYVGSPHLLPITTLNKTKC